MTVLSKVNFTLTQTNAPADKERKYSKGMNVAEDEIIIHNEQKYKAAKAISSMQESPDRDIKNFTNIGAINKNAMIDSFINTQTTKKDGSPLIFKIDTQRKRINCLSFFNIDADMLTIKKDGKQIYQDKLLKKSSVSWWEFFFENGKEFKKDTIVNVPMLFGEFEITLTPNKFGANLGHLSIGQKVFIGHTELGCEFGAIDYSKKQKNEYGDISILKGRAAKYLNTAVVVDTKQIDSKDQVLMGILGELTTFIGDEKDRGIKSLILFGFIKDYSFKVTGEEKSSLNLNVEGIV
jgi:hypothetical protein cfetvA_16925